jgi:hypothetical protein
MDHIYKSDGHRGGEPGCSCATKEEHEKLVRAVDESFKQDDARYKLRQERNTSALRMNVLSQLNGHNN